MPVVEQSGMRLEYPAGDEQSILTDGTVKLRARVTPKHVNNRVWFAYQIDEGQWIRRQATRESASTGEEQYVLVVDVSTGRVGIRYLAFVRCGGITVPRGADSRSPDEDRDLKELTVYMSLTDDAAHSLTRSDDERRPDSGAGRPSEATRAKAEPSYSGQTIAQPPPQLNAPQHAAVDALFRTDETLRQAIEENPKSLRGESEAIAARVEKAWKFNPSKLSAEELTRRRHVPPGASPSEMLETVIISGVDALRSANTDRAITLRNSAELKSLIKEAPEPADSLHGVVGLGWLIDFIIRKSTGSSLVREPIYTLCKAKLEADKLLDVVENPAKCGNGAGVASLEDSSSETREADQFVKNFVNLQMKSATAPESQLAYGKIPNCADDDKVQSRILQTFQLRPGASDVTSYHDFHTLQIAFEHVWTEIFDGQLESLGRELYGKYVELKDFRRSYQPDLQVSTIADLRRLMEEVKKLSQFVQQDIPSSRRTEGGDQTGKSESKSGPKPEDVALSLGTGGLSDLIKLAVEKFSEIGRKRIIKWGEFPGPWWPRQDKIHKDVVKDVAPTGTVEVVLKTDGNSHIKVIGFHPLDAASNRYGTGPQISNADRERIINADGTISVTLSLKTWEWEIASGVLQFASQETSPIDIPGRYVLADLAVELKDRTRVTFHWKDS